MKDRQVHVKLPGHAKIQTRLEFLPHCDDRVELKIYAGVEDSAVVEAKSKLADPTALVYRKSYDMKTGRAKGFLWIRNPFVDANTLRPITWSSPHTLFGLLLHEFGHILGCDHVHGTILATNLQRAFPYDATARPDFLQWRKRSLTQIDQSRMLVAPFKNSSVEFTGSIARSGDDQTPGEQDPFKKLFRRERVGQMRVIARVERGKIEPSYVDDAGQFKAEVTLVPRTNFEAKGLGSAFKVFLQNGTPVDRVQQALRYGGSVLGGKMSLPDGRVIPVIVDANVEERLTILSLDEDRGYNVFYAQELKR